MGVAKDTLHSLTQVTNGHTDTTYFIPDKDYFVRDKICGVSVYKVQ